MSHSLAVCAVKWGPKYSADYANRLYRAVTRNLTVPHRFVCLTDDPAGLECETAPLPGGIAGWWNKLAIFRPEAVELADRILMLDLDVVITGSLDSLVAPGADLAITWDWWRGWCLNGACYLLRTGAFPEVWDRLTDQVMRQFHGDQEWMTHVIPQDRCQFWPGGWIRSYKTHARYGVPPDSRVVCFHGKPKPHECLDVPWVRTLWQ